MSSDKVAISRGKQLEKQEVSNILTSLHCVKLEKIITRNKMDTIGIIWQAMIFEELLEWAR